MRQVVAAIIEKDGKFLIAKRKSNNFLPQKWEFPGGKIEEGETPEQCLKREIKEEFSIDISVGGFFASSKFDYEHISIELLAYVAKWTGGEMRLRDHDEIRWVHPNEFNDYDFASADIPISRELERRYI